MLLTAPGGDLVDVDADIAWLMRHLWDRGVTTYSSCQGDGVGSGWVSVAAHDADRTADLLPPTLRVHVVPGRTR